MCASSWNKKPKPAVNKDATDLDIFDISIYPEDVKFSFDVKNLQVAEISDMLPETPSVDFSGSLGLTGIKDDDAK